MIMRPGQRLLLPASPWFIGLTLVLALILNMTANMAGMGRSAWAPDLLAVTLAFWSVHQPLRVGVGVAFAFGLVMDVHQGALLGQHAMAYTLLGFLAVLMHRRLLWFSVREQALQLLPVFATMHVLQLVGRLLAGDGWPGWPLLFAPALDALLWPVAHVLLLAPQRRAHDHDDTRPI
jgi:rod shape-determining protein MreD